MSGETACKRGNRSMHGDDLPAPFPWAGVVKAQAAQDALNALAALQGLQTTCHAVERALPLPHLLMVAGVDGGTGVIPRRKHIQHGLFDHERSTAPSPGRGRRRNGRGSGSSRHRRAPACAPHPPQRAVCLSTTVHASTARSTTRTEEGRGQHRMCTGGGGV
jgi:hypothetical protein